MTGLGDGDSACDRMTTGGPGTLSVGRKLAPWSLLGLAVLWGSTFFSIKRILTHLPVTDFLAVRFAISTIVLSIVFWRSFRMGWRTFIHGTILGILWAAAQLLQTTGLAHTRSGAHIRLHLGVRHRAVRGVHPSPRLPVVQGARQPLGLGRGRAGNRGPGGTDHSSTRRFDRVRRTADRGMCDRVRPAHRRTRPLVNAIPSGRTHPGPILVDDTRVHPVRTARRNPVPNRRCRLVVDDIPRCHVRCGSFAGPNLGPGTPRSQQGCCYHVLRAFMGDILCYFVRRRASDMVVRRRRGCDFVSDVPCHPASPYPFVNRLTNFGSALVS